MENLMISANAVLPMCLVMALGYGTRRLGWLRREEISTINKIAFRIFLPCLLYYNIYCSDLSGSFDPLLMAFAVGGVLLTFGLALGYTLLTEKLPERRGVLIQGMFRSNYVIMGIPVATALLGADQLGTVSILIAVIVPLFNMLAVVVLEVFRGQKPKPLHILGQIAKNPLVIGSVLGILTLVAGIRLPHILDHPKRQRHRIAPAAVFARRVLPVLRPEDLPPRACDRVDRQADRLAGPVSGAGRAARVPGRGIRVAHRHFRLADRRQFLHHGAADGRRRRARRRHCGHDIGREYPDHVFVDLPVQIPGHVLGVGGFPNRTNRRIIPYSDNESIERAKP